MGTFLDNVTLEVTECPYCGDSVVNQSCEECDDGPYGSPTCTPTCEAINNQPECAKGVVVPIKNYLDEVDIGSTTSEVGHGFPDDWSDPWNWVGDYGGGDDGTFRLLMGPGKEECDESDAFASFTMDAGDNYAYQLILRHLDGQKPDDFDVYVEEDWIGHYNFSGDKTEYWATTTFTFLPRKGKFTITLTATNPNQSWCADWGQVAFSWAGIKGYACEVQQPDTGTIEVCKYEDKDGDGNPDYEYSKASTWDKIWSSIIKIAHAMMMPSYPLGGWTINVTGQTPQTTDAEDGCTTFTVPYGTYEISEDSQTNWTQTYPTDCGGSPVNHSVTINSEHTYEMVYFLNHYTAPYCGDGVVNQCSEECDDGNNDNGDGCDEYCKTESTGSSGSYYTYTNQGSGATTPPSGTTPPAVLGEEGAPSLTVSKTIAQEFANPGDTDILYTITITNNGNITAFTVTLVDTLPTGLHYADVSGNTRTWELGDIGPGETKESNYFVNVDEDAQAMIYTNTAQVSASNHDPVSTQASLEVRGVEVLAETGFSLGEFFTLLALLFGLTGVSIFLRKRLA